MPKKKTASPRKTAPCQVCAGGIIYLATIPPAGKLLPVYQPCTRSNANSAGLAERNCTKKLKWKTLLKVTKSPHLGSRVVRNHVAFQAMS